MDWMWERKMKVPEKGLGSENMLSLKVMVPTVR